ncbi:MAG: hypothetical protein J5784_00195 [Muribaculaceae bacterium]|nr:hypothetical protein [Muribaculaceae bacterium]
MKTKFSAIFTLLAFVIANAMSFAETPECLSRTYNRVTGIAAGDTARVQTWDFRDAVAEKRGITRDIYYESDSLISVLQDGNTLRYRIDRDTLFFIGQRNRISIVADSIGRAELRLPMTAYDLTSCGYTLDGLYGQGQRMSQYGESTSCIDAVGIILLAPNDTVSGVSRAHRHDVSFVKIHANRADTIQSYRLEQDAYRWFTDNYLVSIAELTINRYYSGNAQIGESSMAYMLDSDEIEESDTPEENQHQPKALPKVVAVETFDTVSLENADNNADSHDIFVNYVVSDVLGRVVESKEGIPLHDVSINRSALNKGEYVLAVFTGGQVLLNHKFSSR